MLLRLPVSSTLQFLHFPVGLGQHCMAVCKGKFQSQSGRPACVFPESNNAGERSSGRSSSPHRLVLRRLPRSRMQDRACCDSTASWVWAFDDESPLLTCCQIIQSSRLIIPANRGPLSHPGETGNSISIGKPLARISEKCPGRKTCQESMTARRRTAFRVWQSLTSGLG